MKDFYNLKADLARDMPTYRKIVDKMMGVEELQKKKHLH